jgi:anti-anti-sigma factor
MKVKISTKERFHVISIQEPILTANMAEELGTTCLPFLDKEVKNVVLNMQEVKDIDLKLAEIVVSIQQKFYDNNSSFVLCCINKDIQKMLDKNELLDIMNITPTESEAWDIVQMEEIERELLGGEEG